MPTTGEVAARMVAALNAVEPDLDTAIGTPLRKILDTVAESIAESYADSHLINYQYDINSKAGGDLDDFCALFGITRLPAQRAQGVVTFTRPNDEYAANTAVVISPGVQVFAQTNPIIYVQTTVGAVLNPGQLSADVPVQAIVAGTQGNVPAGLLKTIASSQTGVTTAVNTAPLTGGTNQESDEQLRDRFKATVFRSLAGTQAMYQAIAQSVPQDPAQPLTSAVSRVNILGSSKRHREQVQVTTGTATSTLAGAAYIFADNVFVGADLDAGDMLVQDTHFTFTPTNPTDRTDASAVLTAQSGMADGLYDLDFEYVPQASRNDPGNTRFALGSVNNRIDVLINGMIPDVATQSIAFSNVRRFSSTPGNVYYNGYYEQANAAVLTPPANHIFIPLSFGPILSVPDTLTIGGTVYNEGTDYWIVHRKDAFGFGTKSLFGLCWQVTRVPANGVTFSIVYNFNRVVRSVQEAVDQWRLVGTDARVHAGQQIPIKFHLAVIYDRRFEATAVKTNIDASLAEFLGDLGFEAALQASDVLQVVHNVPGVDNVRFLTSTDDAVSYAMARMSPYAVDTQVSVYATAGRVKDVVFRDEQYPIFHSSRVIAKAANNFSVGA